MTVPSAAAWFDWCVIDACTGLREIMCFAGMLWCFCAAGQAVSDKGLTCGAA